MLHVDPTAPAGQPKGMLVVYNPLATAVTRRLRPNLYYTGLTDVARVRERGGEPVPHRLARDFAVELEVTVPAGGMAWYAIE